MADIKFMYPEMRQAVENIKNISGRYQSAANTLETDFIASVANWEGESKDAMQRFISGPVMEYTRDTIPQLLNALADLLASNADQMEKADSQIAAEIPTSLG